MNKPGILAYLYLVGILDKVWNEQNRRVYRFNICNSWSSITLHLIGIWGLTNIEVFYLDGHLDSITFLILIITTASYIWYGTVLLFLLPWESIVRVWQQVKLKFNLVTRFIKLRLDKLCRAFSFDIDIPL